MINKRCKITYMSVIYDFYKLKIAPIFFVGLSNQTVNPQFYHYNLLLFLKLFSTGPPYHYVKA